MRVALVVPGGVDRSGRERVIPALLWLIARLARRHDVHVYALSQEREACDYPLLGATTHALGVPPRRFPGDRTLSFGRRLLHALRRDGPFDVVHAFWANNPGFLAARAARRLGLPFVLSLGGGELVSVRDIRYGSQGSWRERLKVGHALQSAAVVTGASGPMEALARRHGVRSFRRVPLGVDTSCFASPLPRDGSRLLQVSSLNRVKDQPMLFRALRRVADTRADVRLDHVGEDTLDGEMQRLAASMGLASRVTFHGFLPNDETRELFRRADLFVLTSRHEAGPIAALEAAACALPTVGTAVGHIADFAPDLAAAVPVGDDAALARAILELLADEGRRRAMGEDARRWAREHDADATAAAFDRIYDDVRRS